MSWKNLVRRWALNREWRRRITGPKLFRYWKTRRFCIQCSRIFVGATRVLQDYEYCDLCLDCADEDRHWDRLDQ